MQIFNYYSLSHILIWLIAGRYLKISWTTFLVISLGWEVLELFLPFEFAVESLLNKTGDVTVNILGFGIGSHYRKSLSGDSK